MAFLDKLRRYTEIIATRIGLDGKSEVTQSRKISKDRYKEIQKAQPLTAGIEQKAMIADSGTGQGNEGAMALGGGAYTSKRKRGAYSSNIGLGIS